MLVDLEVFYLGHLKNLYTIQYNTIHTKFHWNRRNFLWTDGPADGHLRRALLGRHGGVDLIINDSWQNARICNSGLNSQIHEFCESHYSRGNFVPHIRYGLRLRRTGYRANSDDLCTQSRAITTVNACSVEQWPLLIPQPPRQRHDAYPLLNAPTFHVREPPITVVMQKVIKESSNEPISMIIAMAFSLLSLQT